MTGLSSDLRPPFANLDGRKPEELFGNVPTPAYVIDEGALRKNGEILKKLAERTGCRILLAQKAFSNYDFYPLLAPFLAGTEASGLYEARLGKERMPEGETHVFSAAYREEEFQELLKYADHIVFNSVSQLGRFGKRAKEAGKEIGLRLNPECSTQEGHAVYDPCAPGSRLGVTRSAWEREMTPALASLLDGFHFHTLCEQDSDALETTLSAVEERFDDLLPKVKWLNMGGGHHITKPGYGLERLERLILDAKRKWDAEVYLEPGEAVALNAGYFLTRVLDVVENNGVKTAILDGSAACHMPDVIEMPYLPPLYGADPEEKKGEVYRLAGPTCLAGDVIGDYAFRTPLCEGDLLAFGDMAIYTTCKNNTFNGMPLPDIWRLREDRTLRKLTDFGYEEFVRRLGSREG